MHYRNNIPGVTLQLVGALGGATKSAVSAAESPLRWLRNRARQVLLGTYEPLPRGQHRWVRYEETRPQTHVAAAAVAARDRVDALPKPTGARRGRRPKFDLAGLAAFLRVPYRPGRDSVAILFARFLEHVANHLALAWKAARNGAPLGVTVESVLDAQLALEGFVGVGRYRLCPAAPFDIPGAGPHLGPAWAQVYEAPPPVVVSKSAVAAKPAPPKLNLDLPPRAEGQTGDLLDPGGSGAMFNPFAGDDLELVTDDETSETSSDDDDAGDYIEMNKLPKPEILADLMRGPRRTPGPAVPPPCHPPCVVPGPRPPVVPLKVSSTAAPAGHPSPSVPLRVPTKQVAQPPVKQVAQPPVKQVAPPVDLLTQMTQAVEKVAKPQSPPSPPAPVVGAPRTFDPANDPEMAALLGL